MAEHIAGGISKYTSTRLPVKLVYLETFSTRVEALEAEIKIKKWSKKKKEALIARNWTMLIQLAKRRKSF